MKKIIFCWLNYTTNLKENKKSRPNKTKEKGGWRDFCMAWVRLKGIKKGPGLSHLVISNISIRYRKILPRHFFSHSPYGLLDSLCVADSIATSPLTKDGRYFYTASSTLRLNAFMRRQMTIAQSINRLIIPSGIEPAIRLKVGIFHKLRGDSADMLSFRPEGESNKTSCLCRLMDSHHRKGCAHLIYSQARLSTPANRHVLTLLPTVGDVNLWHCTFSGRKDRCSKTSTYPVRSVKQSSGPPSIKTQKLFQSSPTWIRTTVITA